MLKNFLYPSVIYFLGTIFSAGLGVFYKSYVVKYLEISYLGLYSLGMSIVSIVLIFTTLGFRDGLPFFIPKYLSKKKYSRLHKYLQTTFKFNIISIAIFSLIALSIPNFILNDLLRAQELEPYLFYFILLLIINSFVSIFIQIINGFQKVQKSVIIEKFICNTFKVFLCMGLVNMGLDFFGFLAAELFASTLAFILLARIVINQFHKINIPHLYEKSTKATNLLEKSYSNSMLIKNIFNQLSIHLGTVFVIFYTDFKQLGIYALIISITSFIPIILNSVNAVFKPIISQLYAQGEIEVIKKYFQIISRYTFVFSLPLIVCIYLSRGAILNYFHIKNHAIDSVFILFILVEFLSLAKGPVFISLEMMGYDKEIRNVGVFNLGIKTILFFILIPKYGIIGIGIAELISVAIFVFIGSLILYKKSAIHVLNTKYLNHIILSILSFILINVIFINHNEVKSIYELIWINFISVFILILPNIILIEQKELKIIKSIFK